MKTAHIIAGSSKGKTIKCKCNVCGQRFSIVGSNNIDDDALYYSYKKNGIAEDMCAECKADVSDDVMGWDEY